MRVAIIYRPKSPAPPEAIPALMQGMAAWVREVRQPDLAALSSSPLAAATA